MKLLTTTKFQVKKSKFLGFLFSVDSESEIENTIKEYSRKYIKATHVCSGAKFNNFEKFKNDSEVGSVGKIILNELKFKNLNNHLVIIVRYSGGSKLGIGGVQRAFRETTRELITQINQG